MPPRHARTGFEDGAWRDDPDGVLVIRARAGDRAAFEELVRRHADGLYRAVLQFGLRPDAAEEVTQEAFLRAWRNIGAFDGRARFFTWLYRIAINEAKRRLKHERRRWLARSLDEDDGLEPSDPRDEPDARVAVGELRAALTLAVRTLSPKYRAPLILCDIEGLSTADAAAILGLSQAAFKSRLHRARIAVRDAIEDQLGHGA